MKHLFLIIAFTLLSPIYGQVAVTSQDVRVGPELFGTLRIPETGSKERIAIIIGGSGPTDRNGNQQTTRNNAYLKLAKALNENGITTFSYDKRILSQLRNGKFNESKIRFEQFIDDATSVIDYFNKKNRYKDVYIIGHSQGSLVGMIAGQKTTIAGFISLAGTAQTIDETIINQVSAQMPDLEDETKTAINTLKEKGKVKKYSPALESILRPSVQPFMHSWMQYNPRREIRKLKVPVLIINGTRDLQINHQEAAILRKAKPNAEIAIIENMNHVLVATSDDTMENAKSYNEPNLAIMQELVDVIISFINK